MTPADAALLSNELASDLAPEAVLERLLGAAKRGKLPGYERVTGATPAQFRVSVFGEPYDRELIGTLRPGPSGGTVITFECRLLRKLPAIVVIITVLSFQPGMWLTDQMLNIYWAWYRAHVTTWWWYMPLMILSLPMLWKQFRASEAATAQERVKVMGKLREALR